MSMIAALAAEEAHNALPLSPISYGLVALVFFALLLGVTWAFRNNHMKYAPPSEHGGHGDASHGSVERHH